MILYCPQRALLNYWDIVVPLNGNCGQMFWTTKLYIGSKWDWIGHEPTKTLQYVKMCIELKLGIQDSYTFGNDTPRQKLTMMVHNNHQRMVPPKLTSKQEFRCPVSCVAVQLEKDATATFWIKMPVPSKWNTSKIKTEMKKPHYGKTLHFRTFKPTELESFFCLMIENARKIQLQAAFNLSGDGFIEKCHRIRARWRPSSC